MTDQPMSMAAAILMAIGLLVTAATFSSHSGAAGGLSLILPGLTIAVFWLLALRLACGDRCLQGTEFQRTAISEAHGPRVGATGDPLLRFHRLQDLSSNLAGDVSASPGPVQAAS